MNGKKKSEDNKSWRGCRNPKTLMCCWENIIMYDPFAKLAFSSFKITILWYSSSVLMYLFKINKNACPKSLEKIIHSSFLYNSKTMTKTHLKIIPIFIKRRMDKHTLLLHPSNKKGTNYWYNEFQNDTMNFKDIMPDERNTQTKE